MQIHVASSAQPDIERIWAFYLVLDEKLATRSIKTLFDGLDILLKNPSVCALWGHGLRTLPIKFGQSGFMALYRYNPLTEEVLVLRIRHQREQDS
jgi:plasmid stabilization system protein ParE